MAFLGKHFMSFFLFLLISLLFLSTHARTFQTFSQQVRSHQKYIPNSQDQVQEKNDQPFFYQNYNPHGLGATPPPPPPHGFGATPPPPLPTSVDNLPMNYDANEYITSSETNQNPQQYQTNSQQRFSTVAERSANTVSKKYQYDSYSNNKNQDKTYGSTYNHYNNEANSRLPTTTKTVAERYTTNTYEPEAEKEDSKYHFYSNNKKNEKKTVNDEKEQEEEDQYDPDDYVPVWEDKTVAKTYHATSQTNNKKTPQFYGSKYNYKLNKNEEKKNEKENDNNQEDEANKFYYKDEEHDTPQTYGKPNTRTTNKNYFDNEDQLNELMSEDDDVPPKDKDSDNNKVDTQAHFSPYYQNKKYSPYQQKQNNNPYHQKQNYIPQGMSDTSLSGTRFDVKKDAFVNNPYAQQTDAKTPNPYQSAFVGDMSRFVNPNSWNNNP